KKIPPSSGDWRDTKAGPALTADYFCQVRFLWRLDFKRLRRLCLFIWRRRFFLRLPIGKRCLVERKPSLKRVWLLPVKLILPRIPPPTRPPPCCKSDTAPGPREKTPPSSPRRPAAVVHTPPPTAPAARRPTLRFAVGWFSSPQPTPLPPADRATPDR